MLIETTAVEAVLRRAIELSADLPSAGGSGLSGELVPVAVLHDVAAELAIPPEALATALAEYQVARPTNTIALRGERSLADRIFGPGTVSAAHHSELSADDATQQLQRWLARRHRLSVRQTQDHTLIAVRRRGMVPAVSRSVRSANGTAGLEGVREVRAAVVDAGDSGSSVVLVADIRDHRTQSVVVGAAVAVGSSGLISLVALMTAPVALAGVPAAVGIGWVVTRVSHRRRVEQIRDEVEVTAERAAVGARPPTMVAELMGRLEGRRAGAVGAGRPTRAGRGSGSAATR